MATKRCGRCKQEKNLAEFAKDRTARDGLQNRCRQCSREVDARRWASGGKVLAQLRDAEEKPDPVTIVKRCTACGEEKPGTEFFRRKRSADGLAFKCKRCTRAVNDDWEARNAEKVAEYEYQYRREHYEANKERVTAQVVAYRAIPENAERLKNTTRDWHLRRTFGITSAEYDEMLRAQDGKCLGCGRSYSRVDSRSGQPFRLVVDHDHVTGKVRGLLCTHCNLALGYAEESPVALRRLADYIERHR